LLDFFQTKGGLKFDIFLIFSPIFSFLTSAVYPVSVVYNLVTIYGITTKFGIRMHPYPNFQCTKFQGNQIMPLCFIATFTPERKEEEKRKITQETQPTFEGSYLGNVWCDLVEI